MHQGLSKPRGCRNHPTAIWPLSSPPRPNRTWRPRQGGPNGQKPALYPVSGLIPVRTCHGPKCPPAQPPSGASGPLAAAILKRGPERPRRRAGSPGWGRARAGGRPLGCMARGRLLLGAGGGVLGRAGDGNKLVVHNIQLGSAELALENAPRCRPCPSSSEIGTLLGAHNSPSGREDTCRSRTARGAGIDGRFPTFLRTCAGTVACSAGICNDQAIQDIDALCLLSWRFVSLAQCSQWS